MNRQLNNANSELRGLRNDIVTLRSRNLVASQEIEDLRGELDRLRSTQEDPGESADIESEEESRPIKRKKPRSGRKRERQSEDEEQSSGLDEEGARVR